MDLDNIAREIQAGYYECWARSVVAALVEKGIDNTRLSSKGWGQEKPVADNDTEEGKAKNRRVEIVKM